ncbi:winged helix-turn-helix domain-containing protein [Bradyrhizobium liaoningense]|uniref:ATP-binding protein n=1 Tax=Bradyrhizobium liaoningense TaxID=43992 RepID=UPI001BA658E3|nr:winged helix-turn-helix domain-containing protein [Bradyrhizobium liaoningense]MBR0906495.1 winged helix-turn-helix domain-containing protein [Bradyrhizobium liaoningense]
MSDLSAGQASRSGGSTGTILDLDVVSFGPFSLRSRLLEKDGVPVKLGSRATDILRLLVSRAGEVVPKSEILGFAWHGLSVEEISLRVHVVELRKVLGDGKDGVRYITNIPGRGYCFVAPVERRQRAQAPLHVARPSEKTMAPPSLPHRPDRMVGRDDIVRELAARLLRDRFVTLRGPGGIGKTTIAAALAHEMCDTFEGNVCFLEFGSLKDAALVASTVAATLGLVVHHDDPSGSIVNFLRERRLLLILDSCEHVIDEVARLAENIYREAPGIALLATSRESLLVEGEQIFELVPLPGPPQDARLSADDVLAYPAVRLFVDRAVAAGHRGDVTDEDAKVLTRICSKLDGIALAIELAAARVGLYGLHEMAAMLDSRLQLEWRGRRTAPPRQQTLGATLDWSFGLIGEGERIVFQRLAIFAGHFTFQGAIAVAAEADMPEDRVVEALDQLVAKSLVSVRPDGSSRRYRLLDATRAYALQKLVDRGQVDVIARRHALFVHRALEAGMMKQAGSGQRSDLLADARAALEWSYGNEDGAELRVPLAGSCTRLFVELNLLNEARIWSGRALLALDDANRGGPWELELQSALGHAFMFTERNSEHAEAALRRGLEIAEAISDHANTFRLLSRLNMFYRRTGSYRHLVPTARHAERVAHLIGDTAGIAGSKALLGVSYHLAGNQTEAQAHLDEGVRDDAALRGTQPGHFAYSRTPQIPLARVLWLRGFPNRAVECVRPLVGASVPRDAVMHCIALCWSASVFGWVGDWPSVETMTDRLVAHAGMHGLVPYEAVATGFRAQTMIARGEVSGGIELLRSALPRLHADRYELYASAFAADLSRGMAALGLATEGAQILQETIARVEQEGGGFDMPELLRLRGELEARGGDLDAAEASLVASATLAEQQGALSWRLRSEMSLVKLRSRQGAHDPLQQLANTYARFSEGLETADLRAARLMLMPLA